MAYRDFSLDSSGQVDFHVVIPGAPCLCMEAHCRECRGLGMDVDFPKYPKRVPSLSLARGPYRRNLAGERV